MTTEIPESPQSNPPLGLGLSEGLGVTACCTLWFRHDRINGWEFNHLESGHATSDKPAPRFPSQAGWLRATWQRYHCWLTSDLPPKVTFVGPQDL